jgi:hypothetical protein
MRYRPAPVPVPGKPPVKRGSFHWIHRESAKAVSQVNEAIPQIVESPFCVSSSWGRAEEGVQRLNLPASNSVVGHPGTVLELSWDRARDARKDRIMVTGRDLCSVLCRCLIQKSAIVAGFCARDARAPGAIVGRPLKPGPTRGFIRGLSPQALI